MKPFGRSLSDFTPLQPAEVILLRCCRIGSEAKVSAAKPFEATTDNSVRARFVRFLALGGDDDAPVHERGVQISGAYIQGYLNLRSTVVPVSLSLHECVIEHKIILADARLAHSLSLYRSDIKGLNASRVRIEGYLSLRLASASETVNIDGACVDGEISFAGAQLDGKGKWALSAASVVCKGDIYLTNGFVAKGGVNLLSAQIEGYLGCQKATFIADKFSAIQADRINVKGSVFLRKGFSATGSVRFLGARVGGQFNCSGGTFDVHGDDADVLNMEGAFISGSLLLINAFKALGKVTLRNAQIGGDLTLYAAQGITALSARRIIVDGALTLRKLASPMDNVSFVGARVGSLNDDKQSWGIEPNLDGFVYAFIHVHSKMSIADRLEWLDKQRTSVPATGEPAEFRPQPWRHLQKVLDEMGHSEEAREVGIEFEKRLRGADLIGQSPAQWCKTRRFLYKKLMTFLHVMYGFLTGYGYRPMLLLRSFLFVWLLCSGIYWLAANEGAIFAPSDPLVFQNEKYASCLPPMSPTGQEPAGTGNWYLCSALPEAYTGFSPLAFSLDLLLPLVDLHQEKDWAPLIETPKANVFAELWAFFSFKRLVRFVMWIEILAGWGFSLLFVAVVSGLARRKE